MTDIFPKEMYLDYTGTIDFIKKKELLAGLATKLTEMGMGSTLRKRCQYVLEELLTNAHEYYKKRGLPEAEILLILEQPDPEHLDISISNVVFNGDVPTISERIRHLNSLNEGQLQEEFQQILVTELTEEVTSGIGLLSIRMKTGLTYAVTIKELNQSTSLFNLRTTLKIKV
jgi:hypothetical protein